ncbi:Integrase catalytic domain-containing protein [Camponotus japonicus]
MNSTQDTTVSLDLALLNLRNTPRSNVHSPASILMARKETKFKVGESVLFQKIPKATWTPGTIQAIGSTPRSFVVQGEKGGVYSRNSSHITPREKVSDKDQTNMSMQRTEDNDNTVSTSVAKQKKIIANGNSHGGSPYFSYGKVQLRGEVMWVRL